jgi:hypothetical protein
MAVTQNSCVKSRRYTGVGNYLALSVTCSKLVLLWKLRVGLTWNRVLAEDRYEDRFGRQTPVAAPPWLY